MESLSYQTVSEHRPGVDAHMCRNGSTEVAAPFIDKSQKKAEQERVEKLNHISMIDTET